jgi:hypothetical protein
MTRTYLKILMVVAMVGRLAADQVDLIDGSIVKGQVVSVEAGAVRILTTFAGSLTIPLDQVKSLSTDEAVNVSLTGQPARLGRIAEPGTTTEEDGVEPIVAEPAEVVALWRQGAESPGEKIAREQAELAKRKWSYEATLAVTGRTGTTERLNAAFGGKATLASDRDRLVFAVIAERAEDQGTQTANREFAGVDYSRFYRSDRGWYARTSVEYDQVKSLDVRSASAAGISRKVIRTEKDELELRFGASYTYEEYADNTEFESPGLDFTLINSFTYRSSKLNTILAYIPTFRDSTVYRVRHESNFEVPLTASLWKLRLGFTNEYQNAPPAGVDRLDTTYFTSLLLNWK